MAGKSFIHVDVDLLRRLYVAEGKTTREIGALLGVGFRTIIRRLHSAGIKVRPCGPEHHVVLRDKDWLTEQYVNLKKSTIQIAGDIGASARVVNTWLEQHGIALRPRGQNKGKTFGEEVRKNMSAAKKGRNMGEANPNWRGAKVHPDKRLRASYLSKEWSKQVRARDGHKCVECDATGKLHAHHVKHWKDHPALRYDVANGVTLCPVCHQKAHGWRFPAWAYHGENRTSTGHPQG